MFLQLPENAVNTLGESTSTLGEQAVQTIASNPNFLITGVILIVAAVLIFYFVKKILVNSILGFIAWIIFMVFVGVEGPVMIPSLVISVIFGLAGVGALLVLKFFAII